MPKSTSRKQTKPAFSSSPPDDMVSPTIPAVETGESSWVDKPRKKRIAANVYMVDNNIKIYPTRWKQWSTVLILILLAFTVTMARGFKSRASSKSALIEFDPNITIPIGLMIFLIAMISSVYVLFRSIVRKPMIVISEEGFLDNSFFVNAGFLKWEAIKGFIRLGVDGNDALGIIPLDMESVLGRKNVFRRIIAHFSRNYYRSKLTPFNISQGVYLPCSIEQLCKYIRQYYPKLRFIKESKPTPIEPGYQEAQECYVIKGKEHQRLKYGKGSKIAATETKQQCIFCKASLGTLHEGGCPAEQCPICNQRVINCGCDFSGPDVEENTENKNEIIRFVRELAAERAEANRRIRPKLKKALEEQQKIEYFTIQDEIYPRIRYGEQPAYWWGTTQFPCDICLAERGQFHIVGCPYEYCRKCGELFLFCHCDRTLPKRLAKEDTIPHLLRERIPATLEKLGREPLPDEWILLRERADNDEIFGIQKNCCLVITNLRLIFWNRRDDGASFEISMKDLHDAKITRSFTNHMKIHIKNGTRYMVGLSYRYICTEVMELINEVTGRLQH